MSAQPAPADEPGEPHPPSLSREVAPDVPYAGPDGGDGHGGYGSDGDDRSAPPTTPLQVGLRHASLEHAPYPLVVGHFAGAPLSGAEGRLDERLGGRLTRLQLLGQYPRDAGESLLLESVDQSTPESVLVLGLGPTGELTGTQLTAILTRGLLRLAALHLERIVVARRNPGARLDPAVRTLGCSVVPIGTSWGGGLTMEGCIRACVAGVTAANERLRRLQVAVDSGTTAVAAGQLVSFERLEMIERFADRIDLLADALDRMAGQASEQHAPVHFEPEPIPGEGRSNANPPLDGGFEVWRRVGIEVVVPPTADGPREAGEPADSRQTLLFTSMGRLARAEQLTADIEPTVIRPLLDAAINRPDDPDVSGSLYELLIPHALKGELNDGESLHLLVDRSTAAYPWELLSARADDANPQVPLSLRVGVLRQYKDSQRIRYDIRRASAQRILVVGNPPPGGDLPELPGAMREAQEISDLFGKQAKAGIDDSWTVQSLIWDEKGNRTTASRGGYPQDPGEEVLHALLNGEWRIVHIAAHGEVTSDPSTTGIVMGGRYHMTANVFASLSVVPDMVFLNACHVGQIGSRDLTGMNDLAAGIAQSLLGIGARAVVAAGWAVDDEAARTFSTTLYGELLSGRHLGDAVFAARTAAKAKAPRSLTWGAYQCYGDPGFRLVARRPLGSSRSAHSVGELRRRIQRLTASLSDRGWSALPEPEGDVPTQATELEQFHADATRLRSAAALADLADALAELGEYRRAADLYREALNRGGADVPVRAAEQVGNMLVRDAQAQVRSGQSTPAAVEGELEEAEQWLERALALGESPERLALLGSFHKRSATITTGPQREEHLRSAVERYAQSQRGGNDAYKWNWAQLRYVMRRTNVATTHEWDARYDITGVTGNGPDGQPTLILSSPGGMGEPEPDPELQWVRLGRGDVVVATAMVTGQLDVDELVAVYRRAFELRSSARHRGSVIEHLRDLAQLVGPPEDPLRVKLDDTAGRLAALTPQHLANAGA